MTSPETPSPSITIQPSSPRFPISSPHRKVAIAVDLSDESAYAVSWAVQNYLRPTDTVILLHVRPTSVLYGADWGAVDATTPSDAHSQQKLEDEFDDFTTTKASDIAKPLIDAKINYNIHIVKDHDMKERLCLEVERLGLSAVIMGSRGFGAAKGMWKVGKKLGSVSDYCVRHCVCPVVVVRVQEGKVGEGESAVAVGSPLRVNGGGEGALRPVPEEGEFNDVLDK